MGLARTMVLFVVLEKEEVTVEEVRFTFSIFLQRVQDLNSVIRVYLARLDCNAQEKQIAVVKIDYNLYLSS